MCGVDYVHKPINSVDYVDIVSIYALEMSTISPMSTRRLVAITLISQHSLIVCL